MKYVKVSHKLNCDFFNQTFKITLMLIQKSKPKCVYRQKLIQLNYPFPHYLIQIIISIKKNSLHSITFVNYIKYKRVGKYNTS